MHPGGMDELKCPIPEGDRLAIFYHSDLLRIDVEVIDEHLLCLGTAEDLRLRITFQDLRNTSGMVLFHVLTHQVVDLLYRSELSHQDPALHRIDSVDESDLFASLYDISVVACPIGKRNQFVE